MVNIIKPIGTFLNNYKTLCTLRAKKKLAPPFYFIKKYLYIKRTGGGEETSLRRAQLNN
jgi:hypothetical protein